MYQTFIHITTQLAIQKGSIKFMLFKTCKISELQQIKTLLENEGLPSDDINEHIENIVVVEENNSIVGLGAVENFEKCGLLRSLLVVKEKRNQGIGKNIYYHIEQSSQLAGLEELYLLTETAHTYFVKLGFTEIARNDAPDEIKSTKQFNKLCPSSAIIMKNNIDYDRKKC